MCYFNLGNIVFYASSSRTRWLVTFARVFRPCLDCKRIQMFTPPSSRSHQRLFLLVSSFLFTIGSCQDITPVVTELLRRPQSIFKMGSDSCRGSAPTFLAVDCLSARSQSQPDTARRTPAKRL